MTPLDVISLADAKAYLKIDFNDEDSLIESIISAAVSLIEQCTQYRLYQRSEIVHSDGTYNVQLFQYPLNSVAVQTLDGVAYTNVQIKRNPIRTEVQFTFGAHNVYSNQGFGDGLDNGVTFWPYPASLPLYNIVLSVGYENTDNIPSGIMSALKLLIGDMYDKREILSEPMPNNILLQLNPFVRSPMF